MWSFGDNTTQSYHGLASASTANHTYSKPGTYEVQIKASNEGGEGVDDVMISVSGENIYTCTCTIHILATYIHVYACTIAYC